MVGYFIKGGDEQVSDMFIKYVWQEKGFENYLEELTLNKKYSSELDLLLVQYYVEGKFDTNGPEEPTVSNYSMKEKSISVAMSVRNKDFHNKGERERKEFIVKSTIDAIELAKPKILKKKIEVDWDALLTDVKQAGIKFMES